MSRESIQFVEMCREAKQQELKVPRYCEVCKATTKHISRQTGAWESLTCRRCGCYRQYKIK